MGGKANTTTHSASAPVQQYAQYGMDQARSQYEAMPGTPGYYPGSTVAGMDPRQQQAYDAMMQRGQGSANEAGLQGYIGDQLGQNYAGQAQSTAQQLAGGVEAGQDALRQMAGGGVGLQDAANFAGQGSAPYEQALQQQASGAINPLTQQMYQQAASNLTEQFNEGVMPGINATFAGAGRTGSGLHADAIGNATGELADAQAGLAAQMFGGAAESALGRQLSAATAGRSAGLQQQGLAADLYNAGQNRALSAAGGLQSGGIAGMGGMGDLARLQQGAAGMTGLSSDLDYRNIGAMSQAGEAYQSQAQRELDDEVARYEHDSTRGLQDWERRQGALQRMPGMTSPLAGASTTQEDPSKWAKWS